MTPGPTIIRECSACRKHIAQHTIGSGNTFGARFWTDGQRDAPMLPDQPWLVKCQHCNALVWIDEQKEVGEIDPWSSDADRFPDARPALTPVLQDYASFLEAGVSDRERERYVRLRTWWAGNDLRRETGQPAPLDSFEVQNLRAFVSLLDETADEDRITKAEALRELGDFASAETLLSSEFEEELREVVAFISDLNQKQIANVAEIKFE